MAAESKVDPFERGVDLFNRGDFFECHEAWEEVWKRSRPDEKDCYQGMIQAAVAILHAQRGNRVGAKALYAKARAKVERMPSDWNGLAIARLRVDLEAFFDAALATDAKTLPRLPKIIKVRPAARR